MLSQKQKKFLVVVLAALITVSGFYLIFKFKKENDLQKNEKQQRAQEDVLKSLTAPSGEASPIPVEVLKSLTAPKGKAKAISGDVLKSLTAPAE